MNIVAINNWRTVNQKQERPALDTDCVRPLERFDLGGFISDSHNTLPDNINAEVELQATALLNVPVDTVVEDTFRYYIHLVASSMAFAKNRPSLIRFMSLCSE